MCGIVGWQVQSGQAFDARVLERMSQAVAHRGPDDGGDFADARAGVALGHRRLSIIDLSDASHQPMVDAPSGVVLAYNGELYNFRALRAQLAAQGHVFRSTGDSEVVLRSYLQWGMDCLARFAGMFALALWDPRSGTLHLARDAMGMKPLYYSPGPRGVAFASEVKAFRALPDFEARAHPGALAQFLEFGYVFDQDQTILQGVRKVAPGQRLELRSGRVARQAAWFAPAPADAADRRGEDERLDELKHTLAEVVSEHLIADVPLGLLLSGGLDSSLVAALAARAGPLRTISMGFGQSTIDERPHGRAVSDFIGSHHVEVLVTPDEVKREVAEGAWVFDDLFADWGTVTSRVLYRKCREQGLKAVLVGEGADELFGGYDVFRVASRLGPIAMFRLYQQYCGRRYGRLFTEFAGVMREYLHQCGSDTFSAVRLFESRRQLPNQYVMKVDKASMAESIEARAPYLDRRVAEIAYRTPREWLLRGGENKYLLRALARRERLLPDATSGRLKFGAPLAASWMDDDAGFRQFARERILGGHWSGALGLKRPMQSYFDGGRAGYRFPHALSIFRNLAWRLLLLELWAPHYLNARP